MRLVCDATALYMPTLHACMPKHMMPISAAWCAVNIYFEALQCVLNRDDICMPSISRPTQQLLCRAEVR